MACKRRGRTPKAQLGPDRDGPTPGTTEILYSEPEVLKTFVATGNSARDRVSQWIYYRASEPGISNGEIARRLGITTPTLNSILWRARKAGWLKIDDPLARAELELLPQVVDNLAHFLSPDQRDKHPKVTVEAAKGLLFPLWKESQGIEENKVQVLGIKIEMPPGGETPARGIIHGAPRNVSLPRAAETSVDTTFSDDNDK